MLRFTCAADSTLRPRNSCAARLDIHSCLRGCAAEAWGEAMSTLGPETMITSDLTSGGDSEGSLSVELEVPLLRVFTGTRTAVVFALDEM